VRMVRSRPAAWSTSDGNWSPATPSDRRKLGEGPVRPLPNLTSSIHIQRAYNVTGMGSAYGYLFATTSDNHLLYRKILPVE
jgi:hypothetical protein